MRRLLPLLLCMPLILSGQDILEGEDIFYFYDMPDGLGKYVWKEGKYKGDKYVGEFNNKKFHGRGTMIYKGKKYIGDFKEGEYIGE